MQLNRLFGVIGILVLSCLLTACSTSSTYQPAASIDFNRLVEATLAKDVRSQGNLYVPDGRTREFSTRDDRVVSFFKFENMSGNHTVRWEWLRPDGSTYHATRNYPVNVREGYFKTFMWHINIPSHTLHCNIWRAKR